MDNVKRTCILGHGRSGTLYTSLLMRSIGLDFGHEEDGRDGSIGGIFFKGTRDLSAYDNVFHQVRHPLNVISSATTCRQSSFDKMYEALGIEDPCEKDPLRRAMISWYLYTKWAEENSKWRYRIEDIETVWPELLFRMNIDRVEIPDIPKTVNMRLHRSHTWDDLVSTDAELTKNIQDSAIKFGYTI